MKLKPKETIAIGIMIISILTIMGSISFAYFTAMTDSTPQEASGSTGVMELTFSDGDSGINAQLNFDESVTKKFALKNTGTLDSTVKILWKDLINTYTLGSLTYTLYYSETENGTFTEIVAKTNVPISKSASNSTLSANITVPAGKTYYYELKITLNYLDDINQDADIDAVFNTKFEVADISALNLIFKTKTSSNGVKTNFDSPATTDEGVFEMEDDYGTSYYYRGAVENNYVKFADFYWRIIRINGDGSLRIIYDGTKAHANGDTNSDRVINTQVKYNTLSSDAKYVGYMYGPSDEIETITTPSQDKITAQSNVASSNIKKILDTWYVNNIINKGLERAIKDAIFCNDRTIPGKSLTNTHDTELGYGQNWTGYGAYARHYKNNSTDTTLKCEQKNDRFTVSNDKGNSALTYPVGTISVDEAVMTGGRYGKANSLYYLYKGIDYWTMTPMNYYHEGSSQGSYILIIKSDGSITAGNQIVTQSYGVSPVINLNAQYVNELIGTGTMTDPYRASNDTP